MAHSVSMHPGTSLWVHRAERWPLLVQSAPQGADTADRGPTESDARVDEHGRVLIVRPPTGRDVALPPGPAQEGLRRAGQQQLAAGHGHEPELTGQPGGLLPLQGALAATDAGALVRSGYGTLKLSRSRSMKARSSGCRTFSSRRYCRSNTASTNAAQEACRRPFHDRLGRLWAVTVRPQGANRGRHGSTRKHSDRSSQGVSSTCGDLWTGGAGTSRPVSRVLSSPPPRGAALTDGHPSRTTVAGGLVRSTRRHRAGSPRAPAQDPREGPS